MHSCGGHAGRRHTRRRPGRHLARHRRRASRGGAVPVRPRMISAVPLLIAIALFATTTQAWFVAAFLTIGALATMVISARIDASKFAQRATVLMVIILGALVGETLLARAPGAVQGSLATFWG